MQQVWQSSSHPKVTEISDGKYAKTLREWQVESATLGCVSFTWKIRLTTVDVTDYGHEREDETRQAPLETFLVKVVPPRMQLKTFWQQFIPPCRKTELPQAGQLHLANLIAQSPGGLSACHWAYLMAN